MPASTSLYRVAKRAVNALPPWLLRVRPSVVYQIRLGSTIRNGGDAPPPDSVTSGLSAVDIRWVVGRGEAASLQPLASARCVAEFDDASRRVAAAWIDGQPVGCAWVATGSFTEADLGIRFELSADEAWLYAAAVTPACRNRGVYRRLLEFVIDELGRAKIRRVLLGVTAGNEPSRRAHARQGAVEVGRVFAARVLGIPFCRISGRLERRVPSASAGRPVVGLAVGS
jgi:GNAT superfamily N-acetyltransferase